MLPFEELRCRPYIHHRASQIPAWQKLEKVNIMAIILSIYASILALAVWQENHGMDNSDCDQPGC
jgi:hypothetical protein